MQGRSTKALSPTEFEPIGGAIAHGVITGYTPYFSVAFVGAPSPVRTVTGVGAVTWISATSRQTVLQDFASIPAEALVTDSAGNSVSIPATPGPVLGTFTIDAVPDGVLSASGTHTQTRNIVFISTPNRPFQMLPGALQSGY